MQNSSVTNAPASVRVPVVWLHNLQYAGKPDTVAAVLLAYIVRFFTAIHKEETEVQLISKVLSTALNFSKRQIHAALTRLGGLDLLYYRQEQVQFGSSKQVNTTFVKLHWERVALLSGLPPDPKAVIAFFTNGNSKPNGKSPMPQAELRNVEAIYDVSGECQNDDSDVYISHPSPQGGDGMDIYIDTVNSPESVKLLTAPSRLEERKLLISEIEDLHKHLKSLWPIFDRRECLNSARAWLKERGWQVEWTQDQTGRFAHLKAHNGSDTVYVETLHTTAKPDVIEALQVREGVRVLLFRNRESYPEPISGVEVLCLKPQGAEIPVPPAWKPLSELYLALLEYRIRPTEVWRKFLLAIQRPAEFAYVFADRLSGETRQIWGVSPWEAQAAIHTARTRRDFVSVEDTARILSLERQHINDLCQQKIENYNDMRRTWRQTHGLPA